MVRSLSIAIAIFVASWLLSFLSLIGPDFGLVPEYFWLGLTGQGLELISFVWLLALLIFACTGAALLLVRLYLRHQNCRTAA